MKAPTTARRSRSNDGTPNTAKSVLPIRPELLAKLLAAFAEVRPRREARIFHGPKAARGMPPSELTDEQVLAMRKMRDWHGMTARQITEETGVPASTVFGIIEYRNRVHLDPGPRPTPESEAAE